MENSNVKVEEILAENWNIGKEEQQGQEQEGQEHLGQEKQGQEQRGQEQLGQEQPGQKQLGREQRGQEQLGMERLEKNEVVMEQPAGEEYKNVKERLYDHIPISIRALDIFIGVAITALVMILFYLIISSDTFQ